MARCARRPWPSTCRAATAVPNGVMLISSASTWLDRLREAAQRPCPRALPADVCRSPMCTAGRTPRAGPADRGRGVCVARAPPAPWGDRLTAAERSEAVATVARLSGLSEDYVDRADLRIEHLRYFTELLRDRRLVVGRRLPSPVLGRERHRRRPRPTVVRRGRRSIRTSTRTSRRARVPQRPALRADLGLGPPVVVQGVRGPSGGRVSPERAMRQNPHRRCIAVRPVRRRDTVLRGRGCRRPPAYPRRA